MKRRGLAWLLALCLLLTLLPATALAQEDKTPAETAETEPFPTEDPVNGEESVPEEPPAAEEYVDIPAEPTEEETLPDEADVSLQENIRSGYCGAGGITDESVSWVYDHDTHTLTISGSGAMMDGENSYDFSWDSSSTFVHHLIIEEGVTHIGAYAFDNKYVQTASLPDSLVSIGAHAFDGALYKGGCTHLEIPSGVQHIGDYAFMQNNLETIVLPESLKTIGKYAFSASFAVTEIVVPDSVYSIGQDAFFSCDNLKKVTLPDTLKELPISCFEKCTNLTEVNIPDALTVLPSSVFAETAIKHVEIPFGITTINRRAFYKCQMESLTLPSSLTLVDEQAFSRCSKLTEIQFPPKTTHTLILGQSCFFVCDSLKSVRIPGHVEFYPGCFSSCNSLVSVFLAEGITDLGSGTFADCPNLSSVTIPKTVTSLSGRAFKDTAIGDVYFGGTRTQWEDMIEGFNSSYWIAPLDTARVHFNSAYYLEPDKIPEVDRKDYYPNTGEALFIITDPDWNSFPAPSGFTITAGGKTYNTGGTNRITIPLGEDFTGDVTISKSGYVTRTIPNMLLSDSNYVTMKQTANRGEGPLLTDLMLVQSSIERTSYINLLNSAYTIYIGEGYSQRTYDFYLNVDWEGERGKAYLWQNENAKIFLAPGMNRHISFLNVFDYDEPIYLRMVTPEGEAYDHKLQMHVELLRPRKMTVDLGSAVTNVDLTGDLEDSVPIGGLPYYLGFEDVLGTPLFMSLEMGADNTFIGVFGGNAMNLADRSAYDEISEILTKKKSAKDASLSDFVKGMEGLKARQLPWGLGIDSNAQLFGCYSGHITDLGIVEITEIQLGLAIVGEVSLAKMYPIPIPYTGLAIPGYVELSLEGALERAISLAWNEASASAQLDADLPMTITVTIGVEPGIGCPDIVAVGARGENALVIETSFPLKQGDSVWTLTFDAYFVVHTILGDGKAQIGSGEEILIYENGELFPKGHATPVALLELMRDDDFWNPVSRNYLNEPSEFLPERAALMSNDGAEAAILKSNTYFYSEPQITQMHNGDLLAVWVDDAGSGRTDANRCALYYSVFDVYDEEWSTPEMVWDDGTADFMPTLKTINGGTFLVWSNASRPLTDSDNMTDAANALDIAWASYEPYSGMFLDCETVYSAPGADLMPDVTRAGNRTISWVHCDDGAFGEKQELFCAVQEDYVWTSRSVAETAYVNTQTVYEKDGAWEIACVMADGTSSSVYTLSSAGSKTKLASDADRVVYGGGQLWWRDTDGIRGEDDALIPCPEGMDWFYPLDETTILMRGQSDGENMLYASFYRRGDWCAPVPLKAASGLIDALSVTRTKSGDLAILSSHLTRNSDYDVTRADLTYEVLPCGEDLKVNSVTYDPYSLIAGKELLAEISVTNTGSEPLDFYTVTFTDQNGTQLDSALIQAELNPGESSVLKAGCQLPASIPGILNVTVVPYDQEVQDHHTVALTLSLQDLSIESVYSMQSGENEITTVVTVVNRGVADSVNVPVILYTNDEAHIVAAAQSSGTLSSGETATLVFTSSIQDLPIGSAVYAALQPDSNAIARENLLSNNKNFSIVKGPKNQAYRLSARAEVNGDALSLLIRGDNDTHSTISAAYCIALYQNDRMLSANMTNPVSLAPGKVEVTTLELNAPKGLFTVKIFALDSNHKPLQEVWSQTISGT